MAFLKKQTVFEHILKGIQQTFIKVATMKFEENNDLTDVKEIQKCQNMAFQQLMEGTFGNTF